MRPLASLRRGRRWLALRLRRGRLEARSPRFAPLFPAGARIERVAGGLRFAEGPVWIREQGCLLVSDIPADRILRVEPGGAVTVYREPSGHSNGLTRDADGRLIACEHGTRRVTREEGGAGPRVLADRFDGRRLNSPNDIVVKRDGSLYFTDPAAGIDPALQEQPVQGVYRCEPGAGALTRLVDDFLVPNGLAFSPDERLLYIDDSAPERHHVRRFDLAGDGTLSGGEVFARMTPGEPGPPDGMKVDRAGHLFCTGPGGVWVFAPDGEHLGTIHTPEPAANCAWGDDGRSLYIAARSSVYRVRGASPGGVLLPSC
jgi:gluconolactonase